VAWSCLKGGMFKLSPLVIPTHTDLRDRLGRLGPLLKDALDKQVEVVNGLQARLDVRSFSRSNEARALMSSAGRGRCLTSPFAGRTDPPPFDICTHARRRDPRAIMGVELSAASDDPRTRTPEASPCRLAQSYLRSFAAIRGRRRRTDRGGREGRTRAGRTAPMTAGVGKDAGATVWMAEVARRVMGSRVCHGRGRSRVRVGSGRDLCGDSLAGARVRSGPCRCVCGRPRRGRDRVCGYSSRLSQVHRSRLQASALIDVECPGVAVSGLVRRRRDGPGLNALLR
jgi:hypothetical protein